MHIEPGGPFLALTPSEARLVRAAIFTVKHGYNQGDREFFLTTGEDLDAVADLLAEIDQHHAMWSRER